MSRESAMAVVTGNPVPSSPVGSSDANVGSSGANVGSSLASTPFNALARKEADFVHKQQELAKQREQVNSEKEKLKPILEKIQNFEKMKAENPIEAMKTLGFTDTDIFNYLAAQDKKEPTPQELAAQAASEAAEARIKAFEEGQAKRLADEQQQQDKAALDNYKGDLGRMVKSDPVKFEYCNFYGEEASSALMVEYAIEVLKQSGGKKILTPLEAALEVEEFYEGQDKLMANLKKRNPTPVSTPEPTEPVRTRTLHSPTSAVAETAKMNVTKTRTLTNAATSTVASARQTRTETRDQKRERLMNALREGKL